MVVAVLDVFASQVVQMHCNLEANEEGTRSHVSYHVLINLCFFYPVDQLFAIYFNLFKNV